MGLDAFVVIMVEWIANGKTTRPPAARKKNKMGCACYDEGYDDGCDDTKKNHEKGDVGKEIINMNSVERLAILLFESPWVKQKVIDIFDSQGWILKRKKHYR